MTDLLSILLRLFLILGISSLLVYFLTIVIVPQNYVYLQERLGRYHKTLPAGFHFQIPFIDQVVYRVSMKEQILLFKNLCCYSLDGLEFFLDCIFIFQVYDPIKAIYETENYENAILQEVQSHTIMEIQNHHSEELFARRYGMNQSVVKHTGEPARNWGLKIIRFEIQQMMQNAKIT